MKIYAGILISLFAVNAMAFDFCKPGDFKGCSAKLKAYNQTSKNASFEKKFDEVCMASKKFKCVKKVVRGEIADEMKYMVQENKKAQFYTAVIDGENFIYTFEQK